MLISRYPKLWILPNAALVLYLSYLAFKAFISPTRITYLFYVLDRPFYAITFTATIFVIFELLFMIKLRGFREAPFIVGFSLALYDSSNGLIDWNGIHWNILFVTGITLVYVVLYLAPLVVGGFKYSLGTKSLLYVLIIFLIWNGVIFPPIYASYAGEFTLYLIGEPFMLALALWTSSKVLVSDPPSVRI